MSTLNVLTRAAAWSILLCLGLRAQDLPKPYIPEDTWSPPRWASSFAAALGSQDPKLREYALSTLEEWKEDAPGPRLDVLRAGLRLPNSKAAIECAARLESEFIDAWESERVVELCLPELAKPGTPVDYANSLRYILGCVDLPDLLRALPAGKTWSENLALGKIHVYVRPEHIPVICDAVRSSDKRIVDAGLEAIQMSFAYCDEHRETLAQLLWDLARRADPELSLDLAQGPGYSEVLRRTLNLLYITQTPESMLNLPIGSWDLRWMSDEQPSKLDVPLLTQMLARAQAEDWTHVAEASILALGRIRGLDPNFPWRKLVSDKNQWLWSFVTAAKARQGDEASRDHLIKTATSNGYALAFLWSEIPEFAVAHFQDVLRSEELADFNRVARRAIDYGFRRYKLNWPRDLLASTRQAFTRSSAPLADLIETWSIVPGLRCQECADSLLRRLEAEGLSSTIPRARLRNDWSGPEHFVDLLGYLEITRPRRILRLLRKWASDTDRALRGWSLIRLARLEDKDSATLMVKFLKEPAPADEDLDVTPIYSVRAPEILAYLQSLPRSDERTGMLLRQFGLRLGGYGFGPEQSQQEVDQFEAFGRTGDIDSLLAFLLQAEEPTIYPAIGATLHPRVTAYLHDIQARRELGHYWWATGQLALQGDAQARKELWHIVKAGRYMTLSSVNDGQVICLGCQPGAAAYWLTQLDTNCCRVVPYWGQPIEDCTGMETHISPEDIVTLKDVFSLKWDPAVNQLHYSKLAGRLIIL